MHGRLGLRTHPMTQIWDGRFSFTGPKHRSYMGTVHHDSNLLTPKQRKFLKTIPAPARPTLPVSKQENVIDIIGHGDLGGRTVKSLVYSRLQAALGGQIS